MKYAYIGAGIITLSIIGVAYWGISPIFRHVRVDEAAPPALQTSNIRDAEGHPAMSGETTPKGAQVVGTAGHPAEGTARIVRSDGKAYIRYENFKTLNGPDIYVYLAKDLDAKEFVNLGNVKATEGNINYEIPAGTNVADYPYVLTWCKIFGVLFNYAQIN